MSELLRRETTGSVGSEMTHATSLWARVRNRVDRGRSLASASASQVTDPAVRGQWDAIIQTGSLFRDTDVDLNALSAAASNYDVYRAKAGGLGSKTSKHLIIPIATAMMGLTDDVAFLFVPAVNLVTRHVEGPAFPKESATEFDQFIRHKEINEVTLRAWAKCHPPIAATDTQPSQNLSESPMSYSGLLPTGLTDAMSMSLGALSDSTGNIDMEPSSYYEQRAALFWDDQ
jgi:hypothetical protein